MKIITRYRAQFFRRSWKPSGNIPYEYHTLVGVRRAIHRRGAISLPYRIIKIRRAKETHITVGGPFHPKR